MSDGGEGSFRLVCAPAEEALMELRALGASGVEVSTVGLGGYELGDGENPAIERVRQIVTTSLDAGVNWFDTGEVYLDTRNETSIGEAITGLRDELVVASKVAPAPDGSGLRPEQVDAACRASLRRLRTDRIDVYVVHSPDEDSGVPITETWDAMARLVDDGLVRAIGLSNFGIADIEACHATRHVDVIQQGLSLIDHEDERPVITRCGEIGIGAVIYEPLASGVLTGALTREKGHEQWGPEWHDSRFYRRLFAGDRLDRSIAFVDLIRPVATRLGATVAQVAIAWVLRQPGVTSAICGTSNVAHAIDNAGAAGLELSDADLAELDAATALAPPPLA
jgi:aryl-alcohol dehydrogenase-like predicted oxidoreductase